MQYLMYRPLHLSPPSLIMMYETGQMDGIKFNFSEVIYGKDVGALPGACAGNH